MKLLIATENPGKMQEIASLFHGLPLQLVSLRDLNISIPEEVETGTTFEENAQRKAQYCAQITKLPTLADDSGLIVEALKGELGIKTRRWGAGKNTTDQEWLNYFMKRMERESNRVATFVSCACLVDNTGKVLCTARGETKGVITKTVEAPIKPGIPLSSVFKADGTTKVHSALSSEEKNKISHRGKAMTQIRLFLEQNISRLARSLS